MSDRPMRLKYLTTKMKIILCIFLLCITVSVFGQSQELNGIVGKSIKFPTKVETSGNLIYGSKAIGRILGGELLPLTTPEYQGRVQWDKSTGHFSLSELRLKDSGVYTVKSDGQKSVSFSLTVWVPVLKPNVSISHNEYPCTIECTAERGTGVTLSWYREGEEKPYVSSRVASAPHLHLPKTVERSGTYTCEAKNSVSNEKASITVEPHCAAVSVFGQSVELHGVVGKSIEFPAAVKIEGSLRYSTLTIGTVTSGRFLRGRNVEYSSRLQWDSSTGLFSLSELRMEDSGVYTVQNTHQDINTVFQLNVYINVSKPHVNVTHDEYPCTLLCTVERGTGVTLSWHREGQKKPYVTSPVQSAPRLHLPVPVEGSGTYTCEVKNSVSNEKASITVGAHCTEPTIWIVIAFFVFLLFAAVAYFLRRRFCPPASSSTGISAIIFAVVALFIAVVFAVLYGPHAKPTIWIVIAFFVFLLFAAVAYFLWRRFCHTTSKPEDTKNELEESRGLSNGNDEL